MGDVRKTQKGITGRVKQRGLRVHANPDAAHSQAGQFGAMPSNVTKETLLSLCHFAD